MRTLLRLFQRPRPAESRDDVRVSLEVSGAERRQARRLLAARV